MTRMVVGPFNRVEGDLEVTLDVRDGRVAAAYVNSPLYRGFEQILRGKMPADALVFAPRICGICSVSQSNAAALALADVMHLKPPPNGRIARNLMLAAENMADHLTHFYLFFMPDFARQCYLGRPWHRQAAKRFQAVKGEAGREVLPARAGLLTLMGTLAGKWPHTLAMQPGGSARALEAAEKIRLHTALLEFRRFLESTLFGDRLEAVAMIDSAEALRRWCAAGRRGDFGAFLEIAVDLNLLRLGRSNDRFMSYGAYPQEQQPLFLPGMWDGTLHPLDPSCIAEDLAQSWLGGPDEPLHPSAGLTQPLVDKQGAYSWCKAPRLDGQPVETGALARQAIDGHPLIRDLLAAGGSNVRNRVVARLLELALVVPQMEKWVGQLQPNEPFCTHAPIPDSGTGAGLTEAARGSLGHWLHLEHGRIRNYQIVAPTTWNFSPRDRNGIAGPLEQALVDAPVAEHEETPIAVQHIVRSFDPCMVCTVH